MEAIERIHHRRAPREGPRMAQTCDECQVRTTLLYYCEVCRAYVCDWCVRQHRERTSTVVLDTRKDPDALAE